MLHAGVNKHDISGTTADLCLLGSAVVACSCHTVASEHTVRVAFSKAFKTYVSRRCTYPPTRLGDSASNLDVQALAVLVSPFTASKALAHALHLCVRGVPGHLSPEFSLYAHAV
jgi:hypothetical protein